MKAPITSRLGEGSSTVRENDLPSARMLPWGVPQSMKVGLRPHPNRVMFMSVMMRMLNSSQPKCGSRSWKPAPVAVKTWVAVWGGSTREERLERVMILERVDTPARSVRAPVHGMRSTRAMDDTVDGSCKCDGASKMRSSFRENARSPWIKARACTSSS